MALIARGQGHRPVSALEASLIAASLCEFVFLGAALCAVFSPELVPWLVPWLGVLLACASASAIVLFLLLYLFVVRPLRILDAELGSWRHGGEDRSLMTRVMTRVRALIEEHQRAQLALQENSENMRETEKLALVGKLAAGVAHSIRNPLTGLKLRMFSLTRGLTLTDRQKEHVSAINEAVAHMEKIVTSFLEISRKPRLSKSMCNISDILDRVLLLLEPRIEAYKVRVERMYIELPDIEADGEKLTEAFTNLVANACEAAGMNGVISITEEYGHLEPLEHVIVVRIRDTGPGIPENLREVVFQPFDSTKKQGTGLGLPIARSVFEEHGGWLNLHCAPGQGATFVCVLPLTGKEGPWPRSS